MEDREPTATYPRAWIAEYLDFVRDKARRAIAAESEESLSAPCGFDWRGVDDRKAEAGTAR